MSRLLLIPAALLAASLPASGASHPVSLAEATERALAKNHDIAIQREGLTIAGAQLLRTESAYEPTFRLDTRYRDRTDPVNSLLSGAPAGEDGPSTSGLSTSAGLSALLPTGATVSLSTAVTRERASSTFALLSPSYSTSFGLDVRQPLLQSRAIDPARRAIRVARLERDRSTHALRRTVTETVAAVERAYWTLVAARRDLAVRRSSVALATEQQSDSQARIDAGTLPESDLAQPVAELARRKGELFAAEENVRRAENALKSLVLDDPADPLWNDPLEPTDQPDVTFRPVDLQKTLATAREKRPEVADAATVLARQEVDLTAARDRILPQLDLVGSYARRGLAGSQNPNARSITGAPLVVPEMVDGGLGRSFGTIGENRFPDASIGLALTLPIGNTAARQDVAIADAGRRQSALALAQLKQRVEVEVRNAVTSLETAAQRIEAARAGLKAAETQLGAEKERFAVGLSTNFFVLTRQNDLALAAVTETAASADYAKALTELSRATGTLLEERRIQVANDAPASRADGASR